jgi:hypothetical protein
MGCGGAPFTEQAVTATEAAVLTDASEDIVAPNRLPRLAAADAPEDAGLDAVSPIWHDAGACVPATCAGARCGLVDQGCSLGLLDCGPCAMDAGVVPAPEPPPQPTDACVPRCTVACSTSAAILTDGCSRVCNADPSLCATLAQVGTDCQYQGGDFFSGGSASSYCHTLPPVDAGADAMAHDADQCAACSNTCVSYFVSCCKADGGCGCALASGGSCN